MRITEAHDYDLIGELVDGPETRYESPQRPANLFQILPSGEKTFSGLVTA
jgi:hypothetical protein